MIFNVSSGGATKSNDNLIDNGWFNVNTRALTEYSGSGYTVDRWYKSNGSSGIVYVDENGIRRADTTPYLRYFMSEKQRKSLNGKVLTFSTMTADGTIQSFTTEYDTSHVFISNFDGNIIYGDINTNYPNQVAGVHSNGDVDANKTLRAVKLEVGAVSTLKLDSMPKVYDEMLKCQMSGADESDAMSFITGGLAELKKSVSDGKREIATTITELGVATDNNASFSELSQNILQICNVNNYRAVEHIYKAFDGSSTGSIYSTKYYKKGDILILMYWPYSGEIKISATMLFDTVTLTPINKEIKIRACVINADYPSNSKIIEKSYTSATYYRLIVLRPTA